MDAGNTLAAINELSAFIEHAEAYLRVKVLLEDQGQMLMDAAMVVIIQSSEP